MSRLILSFDLGTTAVKTALFDEQGTLVAKSTQEYDLITPTALRVEQDVDVYWDAIKKGVASVLRGSHGAGKSIVGIGVSAQGETLVPVDERGNALRPAIVWMDNRAQDEAAELAQRFPRRELCERTGQVEMVPTWPAAKLLWLRKHEPDVFARTAKFLLIEDWLLHRLTGQFVSEGSLLCSTCYWDIRRKTWWAPMLDHLGIAEEQLPRIAEPGTVIGPILPAIASELNLPEETLIATGGLDQACGAIGVGNIAPGIVTENIGAALAMCAVVDEPFLDPAFAIPCFYYALPNVYMAHSFTTGGMVLRWFRDKFCQEELSAAARSDSDAYELLNAEAAAVPAGADGLLLLPHLQGAGAPESNGRARGVLYGFTVHHTKAHVVRSIMEALGLAIRQLVDAMVALGIPVTEIRSLGGGAKSKLWSQIKADIVGRPFIASTHPEDSACLGAAILAGVAVGVWQDVEEAVKRSVTLEAEPAEPREEYRRIHDRQYAAYKKLYSSVCELYDEYP
jgi:sugar (pentulose or hexulose) kinase